MRKSSVLFFLILFLYDFYSIYAQDALPTIAYNQEPLQETETLKLWHLSADTIALNTFASFPFIDNELNVITGDEGQLKIIFDQLKSIKEGKSEQIISIVHIGDSHIRGRVFPNTVKEKLQVVFGDKVEYKSFGINGATCFTFTNERWLRQVKEMNPDFLILSFGTNESHNRRYQSIVHEQQLDELIHLLRRENKDLPILLTTPPGSYTSYRGRNRRRVYSVNSMTSNVVKTLKKYAQDKKIPIWDLFALAGGQDKACVNWYSAQLMRPDHVHFLEQGYQLQGELLYEALIKQYNEYVIR